MGKSATAALLRERQIPVVDTDILARELVEPGQAALAEIRRVFGEEIIGADGNLRREALASRVFGDADARQRLENILHPRIRDEWKRQVDEWRSEGCGCAVVVIPLLFETKAQEEFASTICVACSAVTQRRRLSERGWSAKEIEQRVAAQLPIEPKISGADFVIWTEGDMEAHARQLDRILEVIQGPERGCGASPAAAS